MGRLTVRIIFEAEGVLLQSEITKKILSVSPEKAPALIAVATTQFPERSATSTQIDVIDETEILQ